MSCYSVCLMQIGRCIFIIGVRYQCSKNDKQTVKWKEKQSNTHGEQKQ